MEIASLDKNGLKIKGKHTTIAIDAFDKTGEYSATILLSKSASSQGNNSEVIIDGPGEYEVGGVKVSGIRADEKTVYNIIIDNMHIIVGNLSLLAKVQTKLQDSHIVLVNADTLVDAAFITGFTPNVVVFYGEKAEEAVKTFEKEGFQTMAKYQVMLEKLPQEMATILLQ